MARLTDLELDDLRQEQARAEEEQRLRYEAGVRKINEEIHKQWEAVRLSRDAFVPPHDLELWRIVRAYLEDVAREPRRTWTEDYKGRHAILCDHYNNDGEQKHRPGSAESVSGSAESVACRLGMSRKSLYRRLGGFGIKSWPPPVDTTTPRR